MSVLNNIIDSGIVWDEASLDKWVTDPKKMVPKENKYMLSLADNFCLLGMVNPFKSKVYSEWVKALTNQLDQINRNTFVYCIIS